MMGVDVQILNTFAQAAAWGLAAGIALAIGIAFGLGGRDYVATNIGDWLPGRAPDPESTPMGQPTAARNRPTDPRAVSTV